MILLYLLYSFSVKHVTGVLHTLIKIKYCLKGDDSNNKCPECSNVGTLSNFPILSNESFTFNYTHNKGVELEFRIRKNIKKEIRDKERGS